jgi:hypothetical protein
MTQHSTTTDAAAVSNMLVSCSTLTQLTARGNFSVFIRGGSLKLEQLQSLTGSLCTLSYFSGWFIVHADPTLRSFQCDHVAMLATFRKYLVFLYSWSN